MHGEDVLEILRRLDPSLPVYVRDRFGSLEKVEFIFESNGRIVII